MNRFKIKHGLIRIAEAEERNQKRIANFLRDESIRKQDESRKANGSERLQETGRG